MSSFNPVFDPRVGEFSRRRFDPYPDALLALDFAGVNPSGRPFYKRDGIVSPRFEMMRGASSVGGAGFGTTLVNGSYQTFAPNTPLIGDGGLRNAEARTQNYGYAGDLTNASASLFLTNVTGTRGTPDISGGNKGAKITAAPGSTTKGAGFGGAPSDVVTYVGGTTYTLEIWIYLPLTTVRYVQVTGTFSSFGPGQYVNVDLETMNFTAVGGVASVVPYGDWVRIGWQATASASGGGLGPVLIFIPGLGALRLPETTVTGDIAFAAPQVKVGPDINDPPIITQALPATRTAVAQSVGGLVLPPAFEVRGRFKLSVLPSPGTGRRVFSINDGASLDDRISIIVIETGRVGLLVRAGGVTQVDLGSRIVQAGENVDFIARVKSGDFSLTVNEQALQTSASGVVPTGLNFMQLGYEIYPGNSTTLNGEIASLSIREAA